MSTVEPSAPRLRPGLASRARRAMALVYDALLLVAIWVLVAGVAVAALGGEAVSPGNPWFTLCLVAASWLYLGPSWLRGGQTVGLRCFGLRVERADGSPLTHAAALARFAAALLSWGLLGLGYVWSLLDPEGRTLHDRLSGTRVADLRGR